MRREVPIEENLAANAFRNTLIPQADKMDGNAPLWHGWAIFDAFIAGIDYGREHPKSE